MLITYFTMIDGIPSSVRSFWVLLKMLNFYLKSGMSIYNSFVYKLIVCQTTILIIRIHQFPSSAVYRPPL